MPVVYVACASMVIYHKKTMNWFVRSNSLAKGVIRWYISIDMQQFSFWLILLFYMYSFALMCRGNPYNVTCIGTRSKMTLGCSRAPIAVSAAWLAFALNIPYIYTILSSEFVNEWRPISQTYWWVTVGPANTPQRTVHGANMGPTWVLSVPHGLHVGWSHDPCYQGPVTVSLRGFLSLFKFDGNLLSLCF